MQKIIILFVIVAAVGLMAFFFRDELDIEFSSDGQTAAAAYPRLAHQAEVVPVLERKAARTPPAGYKEYRNEFLWMQLLYPAEMVVKEHREEGSARTITFRDAATGYEFQIYALPYAEDHITEERFRLDNPSGVVDGQIDALVDGQKATSFYSKNAKGDSYEIWIISHGFLYEITTHKVLKEWLSDIMGSWQFL